jgi:hypothetical protein
MAANDEQHLLPAPNVAANAGRAEDNFIQPHEPNEDDDGEGNAEQELNAWLDVRECFQREKLLGILSCAAFGGSTSAFLSSSLALLAFRRGHPPAVSFIIPILGWTGIGSGAHLALRNKTKLCMYLWPVSLLVAFALMRYGATNVATSIALLMLLATANFFGCSLCACLLMNAEYVLPSLGPLLLYRHIPTLSIMICSMAGYYYNGFKSLQDLFSNSVSVFAIVLYDFDLETRRRISPLTDSLLQFKTSFDAKQELSSPIVYSDEIMGVSGAAAAGVSIPKAYYFLFLYLQLERSVLQRHNFRGSKRLHHALHVVAHFLSGLPYGIFLVSVSREPPPCHAPASSFIAALLPPRTSTADSTSMNNCQKVFAIQRVRAHASDMCQCRPRAPLENPQYVIPGRNMS